MGQTVAAAKAAAQKQQADDQAKFNDIMNILYSDASSKKQNFQAKIISDPGKTIPISKILQHFSEIRISVSEKEDVSGPLTNMISDFASGDFIKGISDVIGFACTSIFNNFQGQKSEQQLYLISVGPNGGISRFDLYIYAFEFKSTGLTTVAKNSFVFDYIISSVDTTGLLKNDILVIMDICYKETDPKIRQQLTQQVLKQLKME